MPGKKNKGVRKFAQNSQNDGENLTFRPYESGKLIEMWCFEEALKLNEKKLSEYQQDHIDELFHIPLIATVYETIMTISVGHSVGNELREKLVGEPADQEQ